MRDSGLDISAGVMAGSGVVLCASGKRYTGMAEGALRSLRAHSPQLDVDLFTDCADAPGDFSRVHVLDAPWRRSKLDAMIATRFERTVFLDADVLVINPIDDLFELLARFDIAAAHDAERNSRHANACWRQNPPAAFPQYNTGVIAYRRSEAVLSLLREWRDAVKANDMARDQVAFRELIWASDLRIATLPPEYNFTAIADLPVFRQSNNAPRILHYYRLKGAAAEGVVPSVEGLLGPAQRAILSQMTRADLALAESDGREAKPLRGWRKRVLQLRAAVEAFARGR